MNLSVKNNIVHQRVGKNLKFTSRIKRSSPSGMGGGRCEASGEGLSHDRESRAKRRGGESEANGVIYVNFQNLVYIYLETVIDQKDGVSSVDSTYSFYFSGSGDRNHQGTERRRLKHKSVSQN